MMLEDSHFSDIVCRELSIGAGKGDMSEWQEMLERIASRKEHVKIALVGKYVKLHDAYLSVAEALQHAGYENGCFVDIDWVDSEEINDSTADKLLGEVDGIILPGGFGSRGVEGMICAANFARVHGIPYFGICLGMQIAVIELRPQRARLRRRKLRRVRPEHLASGHRPDGEPARHLQEGRHHASGRLSLQGPSGQHHGVRLRRGAYLRTPPPPL